MNYRTPHSNQKRVIAGFVGAAIGILSLGSIAALNGCGSQNIKIIQFIVTLLITRAAGGTVTDHNSSLVIPPNSLAADTTITAQPATGLPAPPTGFVVIPGTAYSYTPASTTFSPAATLILTYDPTLVPTNVMTKTLAIYTVSAGALVPVTGNAVNAGSNTVSAPVLQLGTYVVLGAASNVTPK